MKDISLILVFTSHLV